MEFSENNPAGEGSRKLPQRALPHAAGSNPILLGERAYDFAAPPASLFEYWRLLFRRKGVLLIAGVLGASLGLLISVPQTPIYQARTTLEIQRLNENILNTREIDPSAPNVALSMPEEIQTQIKILQSDSLIERVVAKLSGSNGAVSLTPPSRLSKWRAALGFANAVPVSARDAAIAMAAQNFQVQGFQQAHIVQVLCDSTDPNIAAEFANTLANEFIDQKLESRLTSAQRTSEWLSRQLEELKANLEESQEKLQSYGQAAGLMFTSEKDSVSEQKLKQLQADLSAAQAERVAKQSRYEIAARSPAETLSEVLDDAALRGFKTKLTELRSQLAELAVTLTPAHYRVRRLQAQIDELQAAFDRERANIIKRIANEFDAAKRREELLAQEYKIQSSLVSDQAGRVTHYDILKREVDTNRQLYEAMLQRVKEYGIASAIMANNVRVVDPAKPPVVPYKPDIYMHTVLGLVTGVFLGILWVVRQERADRTIHDPGEAAAYLGLPELGVILAAEADTTLKIPHRHISSLQAVIKRIAARDAQQLTPYSGRDNQLGRVALVTWQNKFSLVAECFRTTAASILFSQNNGTPAHVLVITSANPQDGKSTTASNLAIALAETKRRVLLIDADLRRRSLHRVFHVENGWGLLDALQEDGRIEEYPLETLARETVIPNLYVLSSGTEDSSMIQLLHSTRLPELLQRCRNEFDIVLIDAPPVLQLADARILARLSDGVIFVVQSGKTTRDMAIAACRQFYEDRSRVLGTVLNKWDPRGSEQEVYYATYAQYYGQKGMKKN
jgi:capsular exopolysaccharide synthesis family protein